MRTYAMNSDQFSADELRHLQDDAIRMELPSDSGVTPVSEESSDLERHPDAADTTTFYDDDDTDSDDQTEPTELQEDNTITDAILTAYHHYKDLRIDERIDTNQLKWTKNSRRLTKLADLSCGTIVEALDITDYADLNTLYYATALTIAKPIEKSTKKEKKHLHYLNGRGT